MNLDPIFFLNTVLAVAAGNKDCSNVKIEETYDRLKVVGNGIDIAEEFTGKKISVCMTTLYEKIVEADKDEKYFPTEINFTANNKDGYKADIQKSGNINLRRMGEKTCQS